MRTAVTLVLALLLALSTAGCTSSGTPETPGATPALESGANPAFEIAEPQLNMATLKDLAARRGERLTWADLNSYYHAEIGWGL